MKVLIATRRTQGARKNDFCHSQDGELVAFPIVECGGEKPDGPCGCARAMSGLDSLKSTTTIEVAERDLSRSEYEAAIMASYRKGGWVKDGATWDDVLRETAGDLLRLAADFPVGAVLERRGARIGQRSDA
jgi:hypothetical protein